MFRLHKLKEIARRFLDVAGREALNWMLLGLLGTFVLAVVEMGIAAYVPFFLSSVGLGNEKIPEFLSWQNSEYSEWLLSGMLMVLGLFRFLGQFTVSQSGVAAQEIVTARLRNLLIYRILLHPSQIFMSAAKSQYFLGSVFPYAAVAVYQITVSIGQIIYLVSLALIMFMISWKEALVGVCGLGFVGIFVRNINNEISRRSSYIPEEHRMLVTGFERIAKNWLLVRVLRTQFQEHQNFQKNINSVCENAVKSAALGNLASSGTPLLGILLVMLLVFLGNSVWLTKGSVLVSFLYIFIRFVQGLSATVASMAQLGRCMPQLNEAAEFCRGLQKGQPNIRELLFQSQHEYAAPSKGAPDIVLEGICFSYTDTLVFTEISLAIPSGRTLGIIGASGSGKTTLLQLILGVITPQKGTIRVGGVDPKKLLLELDISVGYVGPEPFIFEGTIRENISYGLSKYTDESVLDALVNARLEGAIQLLSKGLEHFILENGEGLSAGQKQRLCLARLFLRKPKLIILDEATANLDTNTEEDLVDSLKQNLPDATVIIVTHRASALKHADYVYDIQNKRMTVKNLDQYERSKNLDGELSSLPGKMFKISKEVNLDTGENTQ